MQGYEKNEAIKAQALLAQLSEEDCAYVLAVLADKGYDSQALVKQIEDILSAKAVVPSSKGNKVQRAYDKELYKDRNKVERFFDRIKHYHRISTRYDKSAGSYFAFIYLAVIYAVVEINKTNFPFVHTT